MVSELTATDLLADTLDILEATYDLIGVAYEFAHDPQRSNWKVTGRITGSSTPHTPQGADAQGRRLWREASLRMNDCHEVLWKLGMALGVAGQRVITERGFASASSFRHAITTARWSINAVMAEGPDGYRDECIDVRESAHKTYSAVRELAPRTVTMHRCESCGTNIGLYPDNPICPDCRCQTCGRNVRARERKDCWPCINAGRRTA